MHRFIFLLALLSVPCTVAESQIIRRAEREPAAWTSFGVGLLDMATISDRASQAVWAFGQGLQYRVTLEKGLSGRSGLGVVMTFAQMPLTYQPFAGAPPISTCSPRCDATANVWSIGATFHMVSGGSTGLHQVIQANGGATMFANFREDDSGSPLPPNKMDVDVAFQVGYGLGFGLGPRLHASLLQEFGIIIHPGNGEGSSSRTVQSQATRLSVRYGLGTKRTPPPGIR